MKSLLYYLLMSPKKTVKKPATVSLLRNHLFVVCYGIYEVTANVLRTDSILLLLYVMDSMMPIFSM